MEVNKIKKDYIFTKKDYSICCSYFRSFKKTSQGYLQLWKLKRVENFCLPGIIKIRLIRKVHALWNRVYYAGRDEQSISAFSNVTARAKCDN